ncbi:MBOAT family protein, partial [Polaribacter sp. DS7-9]|nr:MBOAT family protein [Polaribacter sp. DS7-9]
IIFIVSGFWHGANWTFIVWGLLNAVYFLPIMLTKNNRNNIEIVAKGKYLPSLREFISMLITFCLTVFAWIFFRANNIEHAISYISKMFTKSFFKLPKGSDFIGLLHHPFTMLSLIAVFLLIEWLGRDEKHAISKLGANWKRPIRYTFYYTLIIAIIWFGGKEQQFIYFQF